MSIYKILNCDEESPIVKTVQMKVIITRRLFRRLLTSLNGSIWIKSLIKSGGIRSRLAFHAGDRGSNPLGDAKIRKRSVGSQTDRLFFSANTANTRFSLHRFVIFLLIFSKTPTCSSESRVPINNNDCEPLLTATKRT